MNLQKNHPRNPIQPVINYMSWSLAELAGVARKSTFNHTPQRIDTASFGFDSKQQQESNITLSIIEQASLSSLSHNFLYFLLFNGAERPHKMAQQ